MASEAAHRPLSTAWPTVAFFMFPFAYGLSIGPAVWLQGHGLIRPELTRLLFAPLILICDRVESLNDLVNAYIDIWRYLSI